MVGRRRTRMRLLAVVLATTAIGASVAAADASTLGGLAPVTLFAQATASSTGAPTVLAWENFNGVNGTNVAGTTTDGGGMVWAVNPTGGTWTLSSNRVQTGSTATSLVVNPGVWAVTSTVQVTRTASFEGGVTMLRNSTGTQFVSCEWASASNGTATIWKYNSGWASLATITNLYPGGIATAPTSLDVACTVSGSTVTMRLGGLSILTATLSAADQTTYLNAAHTRTGPFQYAATMSFDDFRVETP